MDMCVRPRRVLVMEDEALVRDLIADVLTEDGFELHAVASARDALSHLAAHWPVDVPFTDVGLPDDIDGARPAVLARKLSLDPRRGLHLRRRAQYRQGSRLLVSGQAVRTSPDLRTADVGHVARRAFPNKWELRKDEAELPASCRYFNTAGVPGGSGRAFTSTTPSLIRTR